MIRNKDFFRRLPVSAAGILLSLVLGACNGGGDGGASTASDSAGNQTSASGNTNGNASGSNPGNSVVLYDYWLNGSQLRALPRDDFAAAPTTIGSFSDERYFWLYTQSTGAGASFSLDSRNSVLLYIANNHFYRLATAGATRPQPVQVSSESTANAICDWHDPVLRTPNNDNATFKYRMPGKDLRCLTADDEYREIRLGMTANEAPLTISVDRSRADEVYSSTGQLSGYLVAAEAGNIYWYDSSFANRRQIVSTGSVIDWRSDFELLGSSPDGRFRLLALFGNGIYVFDTTTQSMKLIFTPHSYDSLGAFGGYHYLFDSVYGGSKSVVRMPLDGSTLAQTVVTGIEKAVGVTGNYLVYQQKTASCGVEIYSLDLSDLASQGRLIKALTSVDNVSTVGGRVYYTAISLSGNSVWSAKAGSLKADGSDEVVFEGGAWVGGDHRNGNHPAFPDLVSDHVYLAQGVSFSALGALTGGRLSWVDAKTGRVGGGGGEMPGNVYNYRFDGVDEANGVLGIGYSIDGKIAYYLRANRVLGKVVAVDLGPSGYNYNWKSDWTIAP